MQETKLEKGKVYKFEVIAQPVDGEVKIQSILRKTTGTLNALAIGTNQFIESKFSPFDIYLHVIEGKVETVINGASVYINTGEFIIIPGHTRNTSQAVQPTIVLHLTIKSGYEELL
jgi:quercetin dioxygenase-like cupin family protein